MYADKITPAMKHAMGETDRRRTIQEAYNVEHGITPMSVVRAIMDVNPAAGTIDYLNVPKTRRGERSEREEDKGEEILALRAEMFAAAENLEFERAARLRDELKRLEAGYAGQNGAPASGERATNGSVPFEPYAPKKKKRGEKTGPPGTVTKKSAAARRSRTSR